MHSNTDQTSSSGLVDFWVDDTRIMLANASGLYGVDIEATDAVEAFYQTD